MKRKEVSSAGSSQSPTKKRRIEDESSSAPTDDFSKLMKEYSLKIRGSKWHLTGSTAATKRSLEKKYNSDADAKKNVLKAFFAHLSNEVNLKRALIPLIASANEDTAFMAVGAVGQESVVKMFLGVPGTQTAVIDFLLEKIPDYMTDDDAMDIEDNIPRLILSQFRWLDHIVDSEGLARKLVETLSVCTPRLKKEIVSFIPEIVDDYGHQLIIDELRNMLDSDAEFTVSVVDTLSNLNLKPELLDKVRSSIIHMLDSSKIEDLPVLLKFILQSASSDAEKVAKEMRDSLNVETLSNANSKSKEGEVLTFETLKTGIKYNKELPKAFLKLLSSVPPGGYRVLDMWLLFILHSIANCKTKIEPVFRKQISAGNIGEVLFRKSITGHTQALRTLFPEILSIAQMLVRSSMDPAHSTFGCQMYKRLFLDFHEPYFQQEILMTILSHIGSSSNAEVMAALSTISDIVNTQHAMAKQYVSILQGLLDYFDLAPVSNINQIRKIYTIFCDLYFGDPFDSSPTSDLDILLKKQLMNPDIKYQKMGVVGAVCLISKLTSVARKQQQIENNVDYAVDFEHAREVLDATITKVERLPELQEFFYNELSFAVHWHDIAEEVLTGFNDNLLDVVGEKMFISKYQEQETNGVATYIIDEQNFAIAVDIFNLVRAKGLEKTQLSWMIASMKFYMLINRRLNPQLTDIDALSGCPFLISKEHDEDEFKLLGANEKEDVCAELFHTVNFLREIINIFSQQPDAKTQGIVVQRLQQVVEAERLLDKYLGLMPNFVPGSKAKAKPKIKSPAKGDDGEKKSPQIDLVYTPTLNILRPLELASCIIMNFTDPTAEDEYKLTKVPPKSVYHLVKDLDGKLEYLLSHPKRILNPAVANAPPPTWSTLYKSKMDAVETIKPVFAALCQRLKELAVDNDNEEDDPFLNPSIGVILECLKKIFACPVFFTSHQKLFMEILSMILNVAGGRAPSAQPPKKMTLPTMLVNCFEYFSKFEPIVSEFDSSKALLDLLASIVTALDAADPKRIDLGSKLSEYAGRLLFSRDWSGHLKVPSDAVVSILETNVKFAADSVETLQNITKELAIKSESPLRKSHTQVYFKVVIAEIAKLLSAHKLAKKKKGDDEDVDAGKEGLDFIGKVSLVFKELNDLTLLEDFQAPNVLIHFMKYGRKICDTIVQDLAWMSENFNKYRDDIINVIKAFQACTRRLQWYCENKKAAKDIKLLNSIPPLKKSLESFVLKIKKMFKSNNLLTALWFGNLKHKTLSGQVVDSQVVKEEKDGSDASDNEEQSEAEPEPEPEASDNEEVQEENNSDDEKKSKKKSKSKSKKSKKEKKKKEKKEKKEKSKKKSKKKAQIEEEAVEDNEEADEAPASDEEPAEEPVSDGEVSELSVDEGVPSDDNNEDNNDDEDNIQLNSDEV